MSTAASAAKVCMGHFVSGWTRGVQVKLWDPLRTRAIPERLPLGAIQIHVYLTLPYHYLHHWAFFLNWWIDWTCWITSRQLAHLDEVLWHWKPLHKLPLTWWLFAVSIIDIYLLSIEVPPHPKYVGPRTDARTADGWLAYPNTPCLSPPLVGGGNIKILLIVAHNAKPILTFFS